jgi:DNA-binding NarL/FixJ family response regulator
MNSPLERGRQAFARRRWNDAYAEFSGADRLEHLLPEDLELFAAAAYLSGPHASSWTIWARAHHGYLRMRARDRAARCAFWLSLTLLLKGDVARSNGWFARGQRVLNEPELDCVEQGYFLMLGASLAASSGDTSGVFEAFDRAAQLARRFDDRDLTVWTLLCAGQALIQTGERVRGVKLLDEAMVAVTAGEVSPIASGIVYCAVISTCQRIFDLRRAQEWTDALHDWHRSQPDLVPFRGECSVHRSEIMQFGGAWPAAIEEARRACELLAEPPDPALGLAFYQLGELHRLYGEHRQAEDAFREASRRGHEPQPGLALLRLAQGRTDAAAASLRLAVNHATNAEGPTAGIPRMKLLGPAVEIMLAANDLQGARAAADELTRATAQWDAPLLRAGAAGAKGALLLAEGETGAALDALAEASRLYQQLETPYEAARIRVLMGQACAKLEDDETAKRHFDAARSVFEELGAIPDLARVDAFLGSHRFAGGLSAREVEVLRLVASGKTNREVAHTLVISERTVARHMANIFAKLGVSTRTAASAFAFEHKLA